MRKTILIIFMSLLIMKAFSQDNEKFIRLENNIIEDVKPTDDNVQVVYQYGMRVLSFTVKIENFKEFIKSLGYEYFTSNYIYNQNVIKYLNCEKRTILSVVSLGDNSYSISIDWYKKSEPEQIIPFMKCKK